MKHTIYFEDEYGHHVYKAGGKVLTDIRVIEIDGVRCDVTSRLVDADVSEMGRHSTFKTKRYFVNHKGPNGIGFIPLSDFCWFDPEDEWFADEGAAEFHVVAIEVTEAE